MHYKDFDPEEFKAETMGNKQKKNFVSSKENIPDVIYETPTASNIAPKETELKNIYHDIMRNNNPIDLEESNSIAVTENSITFSKAALDKFLTEKRQIRIRMNFYKRYSTIISGIIQREGIQSVDKIKEKVEILIKACENLTISYVKNLLKTNQIIDKATDWAITQLLPVFTDLVITNWQETGNNINKTIEIVKGITTKIEDKNDIEELLKNLQFEETKIYPSLDDKSYIETVMLMSETKGLTKCFQHMIEIDLHINNRFIWLQEIIRSIREYIVKKLDEKISRSLDKNTRLMFMQNQINSCYKVMYSALTRYTKQELSKNIKVNEIDIKPLITTWAEMMDELNFILKKDIGIINSFNTSKIKTSIFNTQGLPDYMKKP